MLKLATMATFVLICGSAAASSDWAEEMLVATELGQIIGGAEVCGHALNVPKVVELMEAKVAAMDASARMNFGNWRGLQGDQLRQMSEIERTAQCALQAAMAGKYGLMP